MINSTIADSTNDIPYATLNVVEKLWASYYRYMDNDIIATGLLLFLVHELVYFGRSLPWFILDQIPYFRQYKIQESRLPSNKEQWECLKSVLRSHFLVEAFPILGFQPVCSALGIEVGIPFPSWTKIAMQIAVFFVMEDSWHYWFHRALHIGPLYRHIHKQHHKYAAPFGLTAEYAHPVEVAVSGIGTVGSPILWVYLTKDLHMITVLLWIVLRLVQAVDSHSGYDFPWSLRHFLPIWAGADHHDDHHKYFVGNYASSFRWWDYLLGTETPATARRHKFLKDTSVKAKTR